MNCCLTKIQLICCLRSGSTIVRVTARITDDVDRSSLEIRIKVFALKWGLQWICSIGSAKNSVEAADFRF